MVTKLIWVVTYGKELPPTESHDSLITWFFRSRENVNMLYLHLQKTYGHQINHSGDLP